MSLQSIILWVTSLTFFAGRAHPWDLVNQLETSLFYPVLELWCKFWYSMLFLQYFDYVFPLWFCHCLTLWTSMRTVSKASITFLAEFFKDISLFFHRWHVALYILHSLSTRLQQTKLYPEGELTRTGLSTCAHFCTNCRMSSEKYCTICEKSL